MFARSLQRFSVTILLAALPIVSAAELRPGEVSALRFRDVDGNEHSTADGHVTIITIVTRENEAGAQAVGDSVPDYCKGNPRYRYITLVNFERKLPAPLRGLTRTIIRNRLDAEARKMRPGYQAKRIPRDPRKDIFVIADFDGNAVGQFGLKPEEAGLVVFVFNPRGRLIARWDEVPSEEALAKAIAAADRGR
ncbi:MAG TPA: hypothetical protein VG095_08970 [Chthoniobacterales bacterium]|nr:hypothetical protein [Chthoniobacterales bacterium]